MNQKKLSTTFKLLRLLGFNYSEEEYGQVSLWRVIKQFFGNIYRKRLEKMMDWPILQSFNPRKLRSLLLRQIGCHVGKGVFIGDYVRVDCGHADMMVSVWPLEFDCYVISVTSRPIAWEMTI